MPPSDFFPDSPLLPLLDQAAVYTGIGSRKTPQAVLDLMAAIAEELAERRLVLRSGGAPGADRAFEAGCDRKKGKKEIFLPWKAFNGHPSLLYEPPEDAADVAALVHPNWRACNEAARRCHARNVQQVLGRDLDCPTAFVLFWAVEEEGQVLGGTATAVTVAREMHIPAYNLRDEVACQRWMEALEILRRKKRSIWRRFFG